MLKFLTISITVAILSGCIAGSVRAESLWKDSKSESMYADKRAAKVGDIVTVVISEAAASSQAASTDAKKDTKTDVKPGIGPLLEKIPAFGYSSGDSMKGSGSTSRTTTFTAKMTAVVKKVNDNGTLEIEGTRLIQTNKEKQEIKLTGTVRKEDIAPDNTIQSSSIANASITHVGSGPIGSRQKEGIITRILKILL